MVGQVDGEGRDVVGRAAWGGVVADGGEMRSVWGNLSWRVTEWREWLESDLCVGSGFECLGDMGRQGSGAIWGSCGDGWRSGMNLDLE